MFGKYTAHEVGEVQGMGNAKPLEKVEADGKANAFIEGLSVSPNAMSGVDFEQFPIVVFIVSTERDGELSPMNTAAIPCLTRSIGNGRYQWQGAGCGWTDFEHLHYRITASGDKNGISSAIAEQYMLGEKTDHAVYVRETLFPNEKFISRKEL